MLWLGDWSAPWIATLVILGVLVIGISIYDLRPLPARRRWTLVTLRGVVYAIAVMMLLEPAVDLKNITKIKNRVAIMVDRSRSMAVRSDDPDETRAEVAARVIDELDIPETREDDEHLYDFYFFDGEAEGVESIDKVTADGSDTDFHEALKTAGDARDNRELGGVILVSDGIDRGAFGARVRRGEELDAATKSMLESLDAPVNTIAVATASDLKDAAITRIVRDDFAFVHNKVSIDVHVQAFGLDIGTLPVTLERDGKPLQTRDVIIEDDKTNYVVTFEFVPERIGKEIYSVRVPEYSGEVLTENNRSHFIQKVIRDKIRALQVVGRPSWDERFLRRLLKQNPNVDLISFFILRTPANPQLAPTSELSLIPFPTDELFNEELGSFDVVIFQNFNFGPYNMQQYLPEIAEFVENGGGFAMVGGDLSFASGGYAQTPIESILPVELPPRGSANLLDTEQFRPRLTPAGDRHPITQLAFDPASNQRIWENLPKQHGTNVVLGAKDHATVLAVHPRLRFEGEPMPVIAVAEEGEGRVMSLTTDSTWRWGFEAVGQGGTPREYQVFWNSAIRWLIQDPELKLLRVEPAEDLVNPGARLRASVRVQKPDYTPAPNAKGRVVVRRRSLADLDDGETEMSEVFATEFETDGQGRFELEYRVPEPGIYEIGATADTDAGQLRDSDLVLSTPDVAEFRDIVPRDGLLAKISEATGGAGVTAARNAVLGDLSLKEPQTVQVNRRTVIHLWDNSILFLIVLGLLGTEWTLRRRWGRL